MLVTSCTFSLSTSSKSALHRSMPDTRFRRGAPTFDNGQYESSVSKGRFTSADTWEKGDGVVERSSLTAAQPTRPEAPMTSA